MPNPETCAIDRAFDKQIEILSNNAHWISIALFAFVIYQIYLPREPTTQHNSHQLSPQ